MSTANRKTADGKTMDVNVAGMNMENMHLTEEQRRVESLKRRYGRNVSSAGGPGGHGGPGGPGPGGPGGPGRGRAMGKGTPKNSKATVKRLMKYLNEDKPKMALAFFCVIVNTLASLAGSYMLRPIINTYIAPVDGSRGDVAGLARALAVMALIYAAGVIANYAQAKVMLTVAQNALQKIRDDLFVKMQKLPVRF